jgi:hypothetical protein
MSSSPPGTLIATGDLHDNPLHLQRLVNIAGFEGHAEDDYEAIELDAAPCPTTCCCTR